MVHGQRGVWAIYQLALGFMRLLYIGMIFLETDFCMFKPHAEAVIQCRCRQLHSTWTLGAVQQHVKRKMQTSLPLQTSALTWTSSAFESSSRR